ncbi:branched-chain amino acid ABC transporter substrate-binding protein [Tumebacillus flagellatus]|uniref:Leucine-binding protein domain-containing protein n=1 Tax=Tumebacillus flagellatus TaxID=1157490 RepID=A0A074LNA7_9BACL|nr:branched-chain amino acid ABC transporter substrate-binding protein [Tumebacillus flagellatus]KEO82584.1 hypothetical protein EL26_14455 [Tumebacillus flagellatus]
MRKIGVAGPFSGPRAAYGELLKKGVAQAALEAGPEFEWLFFDDAALPEQAEVAAQKMREAQVEAVIGHFNSACAKRVLPLYRDASLPFLAPASTNEQLTAAGEGWMLRFCPHDGQQAHAVLGFVSERGCRSLAVLTDDTFYGQAMAAGFPDRWEGLAVRRLETEDESVLRVDAVFFAGTHFNSARSVRELRERGFKGLFVASDDSKIEEFLELSEGAAEDSYVLGFHETYEESSYRAADLLWKTLAVHPEVRGPELLRLLQRGSSDVSFTAQGERIGMEWSIWQCGRRGFTKER